MIDVAPAAPLEVQLKDSAAVVQECLRLFGGNEAAVPALLMFPDLHGSRLTFTATSLRVGS